jgi:hypothetical protein
MSDLFTTLAREALGVPMAIAPRGRSRFEAPSSPLNLAAESDDVSAALSDAAPPPAGIVAEPRRIGATPPRAAPHEHARETATDGDILPQPEFEPAETPHEPVSSGPARMMGEPARAAAQAARPAAEAARPAPAPFVARPQAAAQPARPTAPVARADEMRDDQAPPTAMPNAPAPPQRRLPPDAEPAAPRAVVPEILRRETAARAEPQRAQPAPQPHAAQTPPAIHVTIGRVEVRAVTPPGARSAPQPKPVKPAMSLADYLEQRNRSG